MDRSLVQVKQSRSRTEDVRSIVQGTAMMEQRTARAVAMGWFLGPLPGAWSSGRVRQWGAWQTNHRAGSVGLAPCSAGKTDPLADPMGLAWLRDPVAAPGKVRNRPRRVAVVQTARIHQRPERSSSR
jgi:hypothetical protein